MRWSVDIKNSLLWEWRCLISTNQFYVYLWLSVFYFVLLEIFKFLDAEMVDYILKGPGIRDLETINLLFYLLFQAQNVFLLHQMFFGLSTANFNLSVLRMGSMKNWCMIHILFLLFVSFSLGFLQTIAVFILGNMEWIFLVHFFIVNSVNFILFSSLLFLLFCLNVSELASFGITYSFLVFTVFAGEILGEHANYIFTILARVYEYNKTATMSIWIGVIFEMIVSISILLFVRRKCS
ncbi:hypothetical protein [Streptococcus ruminantium]|uniref:hypothetical protein n=1 Tax=Streptococcus ruminantium TaxID=1917441 RepID=UPI0012DC078F|nr:hypothetical protein [Streptococcus ruminantium]